MHQFIRVESYARQPRKGVNVRDVAAEAEREPDHCRHVESPKPPVVLYGSTPTAAVDKAEAWAGKFKDSVGRGLRKDGMCLLAGVISYPNHGTEWDEFKKDALEWLKEEYGENLECVIEHTDETHPHLHFYAVPRQGQHFNSIHSGRAASEKIKKEGGTKGQQRLAFSEVMRKYQDSFHSRVSKKYALARLGPERQRLTREQWKSQLKMMQVLAASEKETRKISADDRDELLEIVDALGKEKLIGNKKTYDRKDLSLAVSKAYHLGVKGQKSLQIDAMKVIKDAMSERDDFENEIETLKAELEKSKNYFKGLILQSDTKIAVVTKAMEIEKQALTDKVNALEFELVKAETTVDRLTRNNDTLSDQNNDMIEQLRERHGHGHP